MKDYREHFPGRECREFWTVTEHTHQAIKVQGFTCAPNNPALWWCPEVGFTCDEGYHLFQSERAACQHALKTLDDKIETLQEHRRNVFKAIKALDFK